MDWNASTVQERIRYIFDQSGFTQMEFAAQLGIQQPHLSGVMSKRNPSKRLLVMIGEKTGASVKWLETGQGEIYEMARARPNDPPEVVRVLQSVREVFNTIHDEGDRLIVAGKLLKYLQDVRKEVRLSSSAPNEKH